MNKLLEKDNPILRKIAAPVPFTEFKSDELIELVHILFEIMKEKKAVGVAAPQIGVSKRVIVFSTAYTMRQNLTVQIPDTALINPSYKNVSDNKEFGYEGCLNCGDLLGDVPRFSDIEYSGYDLNGHLITKSATGLEARILQHEIDHLNGFLFFDHLENIDTLITRDEFLRRNR